MMQEAPQADSKGSPEATRPTLFISYAREDALPVRRLTWDLRWLGYAPWLDEDEIKAGQRWESVTSTAIENSDFFIAVLSKNSISKRGYVQKELRKGLDLLDRVPELDNYLIPVRLDDSKPSHPRLFELQWVDMFPIWEMGLAKIEAALPSLPLEARRDSIALEGTRWFAYSKERGFWCFEFQPYGKLAYFDPIEADDWHTLLSCPDAEPLNNSVHRFALADQSFNRHKRLARVHGDGSWKQHGASVYISVYGNQVQMEARLTRQSLQGTIRWQANSKSEELLAVQSKDGPGFMEIKDRYIAELRRQLELVEIAQKAFESAQPYDAANIFANAVSATRKPTQDESSDDQTLDKDRRQIEDLP